MKIVERIVNLESGQTTDVERDATSEEILEFEKVQIALAEAKKKEAEIAAAKASLFTKLGITADEAKLLLS